ncbi:MAG: hypothetical protein DRP01_00555 [Archaeoglobales archaeon]|nr:MAG: hypothetical protein DRP01_00555 [Archaeoglobales archaeon]
MGLAKALRAKLIFGQTLPENLLVKLTLMIRVNDPIWRLVEDKVRERLKKERRNDFNRYFVREVLKEILTEYSVSYFRYGQFMMEASEDIKQSIKTINQNIEVQTKLLERQSQLVEQQIKAFETIVDVLELMSSRSQSQSTPRVVGGLSSETRTEETSLPSFAIDNPWLETLKQLKRLKR